ncbi:Ribonucleotide-diphosphate reductase (RNR), small subunit [Chytriomyces hyalinus]|nr:Ribonucleotide-diphosphate reductase (RNR), small subunit [Chytriomyces hyalinus]
MLSAKSAQQTTPSKQLGVDLSRLDFASAVKSKALFDAVNANDDDFDFDAKTANLMPEPLLVPNSKRFVLFPIQFHKIWAAYKNAEAKFWSAEEIEFSDDVDDWAKVPAKERACIMHALALVSVNDLLAGEEPIISKVSDEIQAPEARCFFGFHMMQKNIHTETLNVVLDGFAKSAEEKEFLFDALEAMPTTSKRTAWVQKHITESPCSYSTRLFALAAYSTLMNASAQSLILHICASASTPASVQAAKIAAKSSVQHQFAGLQHTLVKIQADMTRMTQFLRLVACEHLVNPVNAGEAMTMVREAIALEREVAFEMFEMGGAGAGKKGVTVCGVNVDADAVSRRVARLGNSLLSMFAVKGSVDVGIGSKKGDSLEWIDAFLWDAVKRDSGVVEHVVVKNEEKQKAQEKRVVKQEFSLDEDF